MHGCYYFMILKKMILSWSDGRNGQEHQHLNPTASSTLPIMSEHLEPNSQMELVGHSIVRTLSLSLLFIVLITREKEMSYYDMFIFFLLLNLRLLGSYLSYTVLQVLTSYPYQDPHNVGIMTSYGPQAMVCKEVGCISVCCGNITVGGTTTSESDASTLKTRFSCTRACPSYRGGQPL